MSLPAALLYLLPWALAHSEDISDLQRACEVIDLAARARSSSALFEVWNKQAVDQHRQVLGKFGRYPKRNEQIGRVSTAEERASLGDKENLPMWAGGKLSFDQAIK